MKLEVSTANINVTLDDQKYILTGMECSFPFFSILIIVYEKLKLIKLTCIVFLKGQLL